MTIALHAPWINAEGYDRPAVLAADGFVDAAIKRLEPRYQRAGFDLAGTPFGRLPGETSIYKFGYEHFTLDTIYDGYIIQGALASYQGVTPIADFINEANLREARAQSPSPAMRSASVAAFNSGAAGDANIPRRFARLR